MSIKETMAKFRAGKDERIVAETNKIYKTGYLLLNIGFLIWVYYVLMRSQVMLVSGLSETVTISLSDNAMIIWFLAVNVICGYLMLRKGIFDDGRYAEADTYPTAYILAWSGGAAVVVGILSAALRILIEFELLGAGGIHWFGNVATGVVFAFMIFFCCWAVLSITYRSAKSRREKLLRDMEG